MIALSANPQSSDVHYTYRHIKQESHVFRRFLRQFSTDFLEIAKLYSVFQKLDHLKCNKILELA